MDSINRGLQFMKIFKRLKDASRQNMERQFKGMNITAPQGMVIGILAHEGKMKIGELSEKIGLSISTVSGIIDRLEKQGMVERVRSQEDRRVVYVDLTKNFKDISKNRFCHMEKMFDSIMNEATPEEFHSIIEGMNILEKLLKDRVHHMHK
ncbi:MAG: MarR family winged helix-turn-helix transcriptional regulator [Eubacteriales bacterium]